MAQQDKVLADVMREAREQVRAWPDWKRSDDLKREAQRIREKRSNDTSEAASPSSDVKKPTR